MLIFLVFIHVWSQKAEEIKEGSVVSPVLSSPPAMSVLSPRATQLAGCIRMCEQKHKAKAKVPHLEL